jgi:hypothetical protein
MPKWLIGKYAIGFHENGFRNNSTAPASENIITMTCTNCGDFKPLERNGICASCNAAARKAERQSRNMKVATPISKVSQKRAGEMAEYIKLKKEYISLYPVCEVEECNLKAVDIHHQRGREGERLLDTNFFMSVCRKHHTEFTEHSSAAKKDGYSFNRTV